MTLNFGIDDAIMTLQGVVTNNNDAAVNRAALILVIITLIDMRNNSIKQAEQSDAQTDENKANYNDNKAGGKPVD